MWGNGQLRDQIWEEESTNGDSYFSFWLEEPRPYSLQINFNRLIEWEKLQAVFPRGDTLEETCPLQGNGMSLMVPGKSKSGRNIFGCDS